MTTELAQRRLLESLAALQQSPGGIAGLLLGMPLAIQIARDAEMPAVASVYEAFSDLMSAVRTDLAEEVTR